MRRPRGRATLGAADRGGGPVTSTIHADPAPQPSAEMLRMLNAFLTVQALHAAALLGLADLVAGGPKSVDELAAATQADRSSLHRLLRMLTAPGVFREEADGRVGILRPVLVVVDSVGGKGYTLAAVGGPDPAARVVALDFRLVVGKTAVLDEAGVTVRCKILADDVMRGVHAGADADLVKGVLIDWGD